MRSQAELGNEKEEDHKKVKIYINKRKFHQVCFMAFQEGLLWTTDRKTSGTLTE